MKATRKEDFKVGEIYETSLTLSKRVMIIKVTGYSNSEAGYITYNHLTSIDRNGIGMFHYSSLFANNLIKVSKIKAALLL
jgi:hypothetical protein